MVDESVVSKLEVGMRIEELAREIPFVEPLAVPTVGHLGGRWVVILAHHDIPPTATGELVIGGPEAVRIDVDQHAACEGQVGRSRRRCVKERAFENLDGALAAEDLGGLGVDLDAG